MMFGKCCGGDRKKPATKDAETQSDKEVLSVACDNIADEVVEEQPKLEAQSSVVSEVKIEVSDETDDDDEVFSKGVGPPIPLAENLGTPKSLQQHHVPLPKWFSQEEDDEGEAGGVLEPPATPIGKDELALHRHRLFSQLMSAAQNATEHRVRFDPLGPVVAGTDTHQELEALVGRLENVASRLEYIYLPVRDLLKLASSPCTAQANNSNLTDDDVFAASVALETANAATMSIQGYQDIIQGPLAQFVAVSQQIGDHVATHSQMVQQAFSTQLQYLNIASQSKQPSQTEIANLIQPTGQCIMNIQEFREKNRGSQFFNHLSAISESIPALGWVAVAPAPSPYVKEMNDAGQFYTNRVLKDWKEKDKKHVDWVKAWIQTLTELQAFVKQNHTTGLVWAGKGNAPSAVPPPPPGCPPPPPVPILADLSLDDGGNDRSALFAQINQGQDITKSLKKVTDDMQTHKNPTLRQGPAPFKAASGPGGVAAPAAAPIDKPPKFVRDGKKWLIEYQKGNKNLVVENAEMNNVVYLFKCSDSTLTVKGKINSITLDSCKKTSVVFDSLVSCVEFINCQSMQMQVLQKVPTISIDKTDGCQMYLSSDALDVEIVSSKSSEMNVMVPSSNGDYAEYPVPEQYKTTVVPGKGLSTVIVENKG